MVSRTVIDRAAHPDLLAGKDLAEPNRAGAAVAGQEKLGVRRDSDGEGGGQATTAYDALRVWVSQPRFSCGGTVASVDTANDLLYVNVTCGTDSLPTPLTVAVTPNTQLFEAEDGCPSAIDLGQIVAGEQVRVSGTIDDSTGTPAYDAARVRVSQPRFFCEGEVSQVDTSNNVLTIDVTCGSGGLSGPLEVAVTPDSQLYSFADFACDPIDLSQVNAGDQVAVCGTIDASSGTAVYDAGVVFDCGAVALPAPTSQPSSQSVTTSAAKVGHSLKLHLRVSDAMPGCSTADVSVAVLNAKGVKVASQTVSGVALSKTVTVSLKLRKGLVRGTYRVVTKATDQAGNRQLHAGTALLRVH